MLASNQIAGFSHHQYLWKESINILEFLHGGSHQRKVASGIATFGLMWPGFPRHIQICLDLPVLPLAGLGQIRNSS